MKKYKIDAQKIIDNVKKAIESDQAMSASTKSIVESLIEVTSALLQKLNLNSANSSKPPSSDDNKGKKNKFKQYEFKLISELEESTIETNKLYLKTENEIIIYQCLGEGNKIVTGRISKKDLPDDITMPKSDKLSDFLKIRKEILYITQSRGDTKPLRKPGGQPGQKGTTLMPVDNPDEIHNIAIDRKTLPTGRDYSNKGFNARQTIEIYISKKIIEYRAEILVDDLGNTFEASFPDDITRPIQYGASVKARSVFSSVYQMIPYDRLQDQFENEYDIPLSTGSLCNFNKEASNKLIDLGFDELVKKELLKSDVAHADETSINISGSKMWLHDFSSRLWTWLEPHVNRGAAAMNDIDLIPKFTGALCHDHWKAYFQYTLCVHFLCNAHHLRELTWSFEQDNKNWAKKMHDFLANLNKEVQNTENQCLPEPVIAARIDEYRKIIEQGEIECPEIKPKPDKKRKPKQGKSRNLLVRLRDYENEVLLFMKIPNVPFTNNQGERDIRMVKVQQKISGCFKTIETAKHFCRVRSYLSTCQKHNVSATEALELLFKNKLPKFMKDKLESI